MKKTIALVLAVIMTAGIVSCSKEPERKHKKDSKSKRTEETEEEETEEDYTEEDIDDVWETTEKTRKSRETTEDTTPVPEGAYCLDGMSPEQIVEEAKKLADVKSGDTYEQIFRKLPVIPAGFDKNDPDKDVAKHNAYSVHFEWDYTLKGHKGIKEVVFNNNSYQYPEEKKIEIYENTYVQITFYFGSEEECRATEEAFYNYLSSLAELDQEKTKRLEETSGALVTRMVFKTYPVQDKTAFKGNLKVDSKTYEYSFEPSYTFIMQNTNIIGCYLTVQIPVAGHIYQGGK